ncbi:MAG: UvrABC system protein C [Acidimicrobiaceae bacterium]|nr:excinuclease ABC subunit C [Acidimicrobiaceae bacterium]CAI8358678.1 MAG: UvrABC system protein C [Acidimicrobiaceae bacterium]|tara:strand:- start:236 stop:2098 length:1863 start_codon:yes stop_codon:yes gene_type:complete
MKQPDQGTIPTNPGSYQFFDRDGSIIYVGKAKNLRSRVNSYFGNKKTMAARTQRMMQEATHLEWIQVRNELEALMLEFTLIKEHKPRFNVDLKDNKSYPYLSVTMNEKWPRPSITRGKRKRGVRYFGPYGNVKAIRETLDLLIKSFPLRTCSNVKFNEHEKTGKPCLLFHIEKCSGPCVEKITKKDYDTLVSDLLGFLDGNSKTIVNDLRSEMSIFSEKQQFENAARARDKILNIERVLERQQMVLNETENIDIFGFFGDEIEASVQVFYVRHGRVVGRKGFIVDRIAGIKNSELVRHLLVEHYTSDPPRGVPSQILAEATPVDVQLLESWLSEERNSAVEIRVPKRGEKKSLLETVINNANEEFIRHRLKRATDHNSRSKALSELQTALGMKDAPLRIECYDMSHLQGTDYVGSMVVMEDGLLKKSDYRRFRINSFDGNDDYAAMKEVISRRLAAYLKENKETIVGGTKKFAYPPQLLLVDGGKGQLAVAEAAVFEAGLSDLIFVASLAKQFEEVFIAGQREPVVIPRNSEALYMLQRLRDESHRFAVEYHRKLRGKRMTESVLDGIPGLGEKRKNRLLKEYGSLKRVKESSLKELNEIKWLPEKVAIEVAKKLDLDLN